MSPHTLKSARDISYASSAQTAAGKLLIRITENLTGRPGLIRRAKGYESDIADGRSFWNVVPDRFGLSLDVTRGSIADIPSSGPLIVVSNHPYGILDGLMLGHILSITRGDFRILAHRVFRGANDLDRVILPISFDETKDAVRANLHTRQNALNFLSDGGAIGVFPGGTVSTGLNRHRRPLDPVWRTFTAKMIMKSGATVVPIYFDGMNSPLFQSASRMHYTLRMALLIREFRKQTDRPVKVAIGKPIDTSMIADHGADGWQLMQFLRQQTYSLASDVSDPTEIGYEFEEKYRGR